MSKQEQVSPTAGVIPPPLIYAAALGVGGIPTWIAPRRLFDHALAGRLAGGSLLVAGLALSLWMMAHFRRAGTPVSPLEAARSLVVSGPYRFSRNPDYLGQGLVFVGVALLLNSAWLLAAFVPAVLLVRYAVIAREERYLRLLFGEEYESYARSVRRWL